MVTLSETETTRLLHAADKRKTLRKMGYTEDTDELLWHFIVEEGLFPLDRHSLKYQLKYAESRSKEDQIRFFHALADPTWVVYLYKRQQHIDRYLERLAQEHPDALREHYTSLTPPYNGWAAAVLAQHGGLAPDGASTATFAAEVYPDLARCYLMNAYPWFYWEGIEGGLEAYVDDDLWERACLDLALDGPVNWKRMPANALSRASDDELLRIGVLQSSEAPITEAVAARGERLLPALEELFADRDRAQEGSDGLGLFLGYALLRHEAGLPQPEALVRWAERELWRAGWGIETELLKQALQLLPLEQARALLLQAPLQNRTLGRVFPALQDEEVIASLLDRLQAAPDDEWAPSHYSDGFAEAGLIAIPAIEQALQDPSTSARLATTLANALVEMGAPPESQALLGSLLYHSSKRVREAAAAGLALRGDDALGLLQTALLASKKPIRLAALHALGNTAPTPARDALLDAVLQESKHSEIIAALNKYPRAGQDNATTSGGDLLQQTITLFAEQDHGRNHKIAEKWRQRYMWDEEVSDEELLKNGPTDIISLWPTTGLEMWRPALAHFVDEPIAPWLAVYKISQMDLSYLEEMIEELRDSLRIFGDKLTEPLCAFALYGYNTGILLPLLVECAPERALAVLLEGIDVTQSGGLYLQVKPVRDASIATIAMLGEVAVEPLCERLGARKKDQRLAAAEALALIASPSAVEPLEAAFKKEKVRAVQSALSKAIDASVLAGQDGHATFDAMDDAAIDAYLAEVHFVPLPDIMDLRALPVLQLRSGHALSPDARWGWVSQLSHEAPGRPNAIAHTLRERFDRASLCAFGRAIELLDHHPGPALRWLHHQRAITASNAWLQDLGWLHEHTITMLKNHGSVFSRLKLQYHSAKDDYYSAYSREAYSEIPEEDKPSEAMCAAFHEEQTDAGLPTHELNKDALLRHEEEDEGYWMWLDPKERPTLGAPISGFALRLDDAQSNDENLRVTGSLLVKKIEGNITKTCRQMRERLAAIEETPRAWTTAGWHAIFGQHPLWSMLGQGLLFQNEAGQHFLMHPEGHPVDAKGDAVALEEDGFVNLAETAQLDEDTRAAWQALLDEWYDKDEIRLAEAPEDPLFALRDLLYTPASEKAWQALVTLLEGWPQDDTLPMALAYIDAHIGAWDDLVRQAPHEWSWLLLDSTNTKHKEHIDMGAGFQGDASHLMQACNALHFNDCNIKPADARSLCEASLQHITRLSFHWGRLYKGADTYMAKHLSLPALTHINLCRLSIRRLGWEELFGAPWFQRCTHIALSAMELDWQRLGQLVESGALANTQMLDITENHFGLPGVEVLLNAPPLPALKSLAITYDNMGVDGFAAFCASGHFSQLEELTLIAPPNWYYEDDTVTPLLTHAENFPHLKKLVLHQEHAEPRYTRRDWVQSIAHHEGFPEAMRQQFRALYLPETNG